MRHLLAAPAAVALLLAVGCTPDDGEPTPLPPSPTVSVASSAPSPTPMPSTSPTVAESFPPAPATESAEQAAVRAAWMEYWRVYEKYAADPSLADLSETQQVTTGEAQNVILEAIGTLRDEDRAFLGGWNFRDVVITQPTESPTGDRAARLNYCVDRSAMVFEDTTSGARSERSMPNLKETSVLVQGPDGRWRLAQRRNEAQDC